MNGIMLNISQTARVLGVSRPTLYKLIREEQIKYRKRKDGRVYFLSEDIEAYIKGEKGGNE